MRNNKPIHPQPKYPILEGDFLARELKKEKRLLIIRKKLSLRILMMRANCIKVGHIRLPNRKIPINFSSSNFNDDKYGFFYFYVRDILRDFGGVGDKKLKNIEEFIKLFRVKTMYSNRFPIKFYTWYRVFNYSEDVRYKLVINELNKYSFVKIRFKTYTELMKYKMAKEV